MILERKLKIRESLEQLLSAIPVDNLASKVIEQAHTKYVRNVNMSLLEKLWFLDETMRKFNTYQAVPEVNNWLLETISFFRDNKLSVEALTIANNLKKSKDSTFYKHAVNTLEQLLQANSENTIAKAIVESDLKEFKWINDISYLLENAIRVVRGVNFTHPDFEVSNVVSPIQIVKEQNGTESYVFFAGGRVTKFNEATGFKEYSAQMTNREFLPLISVVETLNVSENSISQTINGKLLKIEETATGDKMITYGGAEVEPTNLSTLIYTNGGFLNPVVKLAQNFVAAYENFDNFYNLDFAKRIESRKQPNLKMYAYRQGSHVALQMIDTYLNENKFKVYEDATQAIEEANYFIGFDLTSLFSDLIQDAQSRKLAAEEAVRGLQESVVLLMSKRDNFKSKAILNETIDTTEIQEALKSLDKAIDDKYAEMDRLLPNHKKHSKVMTGTVLTNLGVQNIMFESKDYIDQSTAIKVSNGEQTFYVEKKHIKI